MSHEFISVGVTEHWDSS